MKWKHSEFREPLENGEPDGHVYDLYYDDDTIVTVNNNHPVNWNDCITLFGSSGEEYSIAIGKDGGYEMDEEEYIYMLNHPNEWYMEQLL